MKVISLLFVLSLSFAVHANEGPCAKDRETYCGNVEQGEGRVMKCMEDHSDKLSTECKEFRAKAKEDVKEVAAACQEDVEKLCAGKKKKALIRCLHKNKSKLSDGCKAEVKDLKAKHHKRK